MKRNTLFLFDLDGTLVSTGGAGLRALNRAFDEKYSIKNVSSKINPAGKTDPAIFREIIETFLMRSATDDEMRQAAELYLQYLKIEIDITSQVRILPGVEDMLGFLSTQSDAIIALGTGNLERGARIKLGPTGLNAYFSFGGFGSDAEDRAEMLLAGARKAERQVNDRIDPSSVFVIGDTPLDVRAARRAGFKAVAVASGHVSFDDLKNENPDHVLKNLTEGIEFVQKLS